MDEDKDCISFYLRDCIAVPSFILCRAESFFPSLSL